MESFLGGKVTLLTGNMLALLPTLPDNSFDSCVCDPPYHLTSIVQRFGAEDAAPAKSNGATGVYKRASTGFMGKQWDGGNIAFRPETWREVYRVLKPGAHLLAFSGTRTYHRMACAIEDAGFEIRDTIMWLYGSGFPKSHNVSKSIDREAGAERPEGDLRTDGRGAWNLKIDNHALGDTGIGHADGSKKVYRETIPATEAAAQWQGWGTALKPAVEPIVLARKPLSEGTVAANVLRWGTGALNIDSCRTATDDVLQMGKTALATKKFFSVGERPLVEKHQHVLGRWPANVAHDGSDEVVAAFPESESVGHHPAKRNGASMWSGEGGGLDGNSGPEAWTDTGSAARFFYTAKADADDRLGSKHPTVKPLDLMQWLVRLVTPRGGMILDPFAGTGTTGEAAWREGFSATLVEREQEYQRDIRRRMELALAGPDERARESLKAAGRVESVDTLPLFGGGG